VSGGTGDWDEGHAHAALDAVAGELKQPPHQSEAGGVLPRPLF
jgi:hypothetical protein